MALTANSLVKATGAAAIGDADLSGAVTTSGSTVTTLASGLSPDFAAISLGSQKLQSFTWQIQNDSGTLKHAFFGNSVGTTNASSYVDKVTGTSTTPAATPTVAAGVDFTNGAGITTNNAVFNTAAQVANTFFGEAQIIYYSGNNTRCRAAAGFVSRNVNGTTRVRLEIAIFNDMTGGAVNFDTTLLPSGAQMQIRFTGFLA